MKNDSKKDCILNGTDLAGRCIEAGCCFYDRETGRCTYVKPENRIIIQDNRKEKEEEVKE